MRTHVLGISGLLPESSAIVSEPWDPERPRDTSTLSVAHVLYDALGRPQPVTFFFSHIEPLRWGLHLLLEKGSGFQPLADWTLLLRSGGPLIRVDGPGVVRLPLAADLAGPPIALDFGLPLDEDGVESFRFISLPENEPWLSPWSDGKPSEPGCAE